MHRTRFMTWIFIALSLAFFAVPSFRYALEAPLFSFGLVRAAGSGAKGRFAHWCLRRFSLQRYISAESMRRQSEDAIRQGKPELAALAALTLRLDRHTLRLADEAAQKDPDLTWIYLPMILRAVLRPDWEPAPEIKPEDIAVRLAKLEKYDPDNGMPHLICAMIVEQRKGLQPIYSVPFEREEVQKRIAEKDWMKEIERAFASPRFDRYAVRELNLFRKVTRERGWTHPAVFASYWFLRPFLASWLTRPHWAVLLYQGEQAQERGDCAEGVADYEKAAVFAERVSLQSAEHFERLWGMGNQAKADKFLALGLRGCGKFEQADFLSRAARQADVEANQLSDYARSSASRDLYAALVTGLSASLVWVFLVLTVASIIYVNFKLRFRKEKKGRLFELVTTAENYLPIVLFAACAALHTSFLPYGANYSSYMEPGDYSRIPLFAPFGVYPAIDLSEYFEMERPLPFVGYIPYAVGAMAALFAVASLARWRDARRRAAAGGPAAPSPFRRTNIAILILVVVTTVATVLYARADWAPILVGGGLELFGIGAALWATTTLGSRQKMAVPSSGSSWRLIGVAWLLFFGLAAASALGLYTLGYGTMGPIQVQHWPYVMLFLPVIASGLVAANRLRPRRVGLTLFSLVALAGAAWGVYSRWDEIQLERATSRRRATEGARHEQLRRQELQQLQKLARLQLRIFDVMLRLAEHEPQLALSAELHERGINFDLNTANRDLLREAAMGAEFPYAGVQRASPSSTSTAQQWGDPMSACRQALRKAPENPSLHFVMGYFLQIEREEDAAIAEYRQALKLNPGYAGAHHWLGVALRKDYPAEALKELRRSVQLDPKVLSAWRDLDRALLASNPEEAFGGARPPSYSPRNDHASLASNPEEALLVAQEALRLFPGNDDLRHLLIEAHLERHDWDLAILESQTIRGAEEEFRLPPRGNRDFTDAHIELGLVLELEGNLVGAIKEFREVLKQSPKNSAAHRNLAEVLQKNGDTKGALEEYRAALQLDPRDPQTRAALEALQPATRTEH